MQMKLEITFDNYKQYIAFLDNCLISMNRIWVNGQDITPIYEQLAKQLQKDENRIK
jgi:glutathione peroxidase-family protein